MKQLHKVEIGKMRQLADFLETVPPEDFDLAKWRLRSPVSAIRLGPITLRQGCGFAGCALGWAAHMEVFPGLTLGAKDNTVYYRGYSEFRAAATLFEVNTETAVFLFHENSYWPGYVEPGDVAERLRRFAEIVERRIARHTVPRLQLVA